MKILAIDSSAISAGCAIVDDGNLIAESFVRVGLTHSETLLPMVSNTLANAKLTADDIDCYAVSSGPGSFTGIRIGVASVKGMAFASGTPCVGVSTLEAIAWSCVAQDGVICAVMDARRQQVYNALFTSDGQDIVRICADRAVSIEELTEELKNYQPSADTNSVTLDLKKEGKNWTYDDASKFSDTITSAVIKNDQGE